MLLALIKNREIIIVKYMKKVKIDILYVKYYQVLKISQTFVVYNMRNNAKNRS